MSTRKYPDDFMNKIICGDCLDIMKEIPDKSIDAIITDVPYNLGDTDSEIIKFKDRANMNRATKDRWNKGFNPTAFLPEAKRILKKEGNIFIYTHPVNYVFVLGIEIINGILKHRIKCTILLKLQSVWEMKDQVIQHRSLSKQ